MNTEKPAAPKSSPLPWFVGEDTLGAIRIRHSKGDVRDSGIVASVHTTPEWAGEESNAAIIVRRVNDGPYFDNLIKSGNKLVEDVGGLDLGGAQDSWIVFIAALKMAQEVL